MPCIAGCTTCVAPTATTQMTCSACASGWTLTNGGCCKDGLCTFPHEAVACQEEYYKVGSTDCVKLADLLPTSYTKQDTKCWKGYV